MAHYVIGDIHGCFIEFTHLRDYILSQDPQAVFLLLGDITDRGPDVMEMLQWAMEHVTADGQYQMVLGNHELEIIDWYRYHFLPWYEIGNPNRRMPETRYSFSTVMKEYYMLSPKFLEPVIRFFEELPLFINLEVQSPLRYTAHIAHAWYPDKYRIPACTEEDYVWSREHISHEFHDIENADAILIHGHTPTLDKHCISSGAVSGEIWFKQNSINVDCGCCYKDFNGQLAGLCLETLDEYYCRDTVVTKKERPFSDGRLSMIKRFSGDSK